MNKIKLGILGLGSQTTLYYISELNRLFNLKNDGYSTCPFILWNTNFNAINALLPNNSPELNTITQKCIKEVEKLEPDYILIPNITLHESIDQLEVQKTILHPVHLTASKIKEKKYLKVIVMGSEYTMNSTYIRSIFKANTIEIEIPTDKDRAKIDEFRKQVYAKKETKTQIEDFHKIIEKYSTINPVVLACTELSIYKPSKPYENLFDMVGIQISEAINKL